MYVALAIGMVALGGVRVWSAALMAGVAVLAGLLVLTHHVRKRRAIRIPYILVPLLCGWVLTALQLVPLPTELPAWLGRDSHAVLVAHATWMTVLGQPPRAAMWSLDAPMTTLALLRLAGASFIAFTLHAAVRRGRHRQRVLTMLAAVFVAGLVVAMGHLVAGEYKIWGAVATSRVPLNGPLVNPNHNARLWLFAATVCAAGSYGVRRERRWIWYAGAAVFGLATTLTLSRGGLLAAALLIALLSANHGQRRTRALLVAGASALGLFTLAFVYAPRLWRAEMDATLGASGLDKLALAWKGLELAARAPLTGYGNNAAGPMLRVGQGPQPWTAFDTSFGQYRYIESAPVETLANHGLLLGGALLVCVGWLALKAWRATTDAPQPRALVIGLLVVTCADAADFFLEIPLGLALTAALAALVSRRGLELPLPAAALGFLFIAGTTAGLTALHAGDETARLDAALEQFKAPAGARGNAAADEVVLLRRAARAHPADGFAQIRLARHVFMRGDHAAAARGLELGTLLWRADPVAAQLAIDLGLATGDTEAVKSAVETLAASAPALVLQSRPDLLGRLPVDALDILIGAVSAAQHRAYCAALRRQNLRATARCYQRLTKRADATEVHKADAIGFVRARLGEKGARAAFYEVYPSCKASSVCGDGERAALWFRTERGFVPSPTEHRMRALAGAQKLTTPAPLLLEVLKNAAHAADATSYQRAWDLLGLHGRQRALRTVLGAEATLALNQGRDAEALRTLERALRLAPRNRNLLIQVFDLQLKLVQLDAARQTLGMLKRIGAPDEKRARALSDARARRHLELITP